MCPPSSKIKAAEHHIPRRYPARAAMLPVQRSVTRGDELCRRSPQRARRALDPARRPFQLQVIADRRLVQHYRSSLTRPSVFGAIFFVAEDRLVAEALED